jgi:glycosyltransferase involved in cell wall biosynthesis
MKFKDLSIVIPSKNEGKNLEFILPILRKYSDDIWVVDAHSKDGTKSICKKNHINYFLDNKLGKGDAQRVGAKLVKNKIIIFFDSDGSHDYKDINLLYKNIKKNNFDLVVCSRKSGGSLDLTANLSFIGFIRAVGCDFLCLIFNKLFKTSFSDVLYSLKAIKKNKFEELNTNENSFGIEIEILTKATKKNYKVIEIPSRERARVYGESKLNTIVGVYFIYQIFKGKWF